jgi:hypothetical protein
MRRPVFLLCAFFALLAPAALAGPVETAVRAADAARVAATIAGDVTRLGPLLSDQLAYGHADGRVQTKTELLAALGSSRMRYETYDYEETQINPVDDEVATMTGRARLVVRADDRHLAFRLRFLAVWHREHGVWRLFAYQSAQLPAPANP